MGMPPKKKIKVSTHTNKSSSATSTGADSSIHMSDAVTQVTGGRECKSTTSRYNYSLYFNNLKPWFIMILDPACCQAALTQQLLSAPSEASVNYSWNLSVTLSPLWPIPSMLRGLFLVRCMRKPAMRIEAAVKEVGICWSVLRPELKCDHHISSRWSTSWSLILSWRIWLRSWFRATMSL